MQLHWHDHVAWIEMELELEDEKSTALHVCHSPLIRCRWRPLVCWSMGQGKVNRLDIDLEPHEITYALVIAGLRRLARRKPYFCDEFNAQVDKSGGSLISHHAIPP